MTSLHHVTAIGRDMDFYSKVLGLKLVKKTVNFDDPTTYHIYFGDEVGSPGTALTFFLWDLPPMKKGYGAISKIMYRASELDSWERTLKRFKAKRYKRFGDDMLSFTDTNGMEFELVDTKDRKLERFYGAVLNIKEPDRDVLNVLGFDETGKEGDFIRFKEKEDVIDVKLSKENHFIEQGMGAVHHIAFRAKDDNEQMQLRKRLIDIGLRVTNQVERLYFRSIYFRLRSGVLFEIATDKPGFTVDEKKEELGKNFMLPPQYEPMRAAITAHLRTL